MIEREFADAPLADRRLAQRLVKIAAMARSGGSFPRMARSDGELEGIYRFLNNHRVGADGILDPHYRATLAGMAPLKRVAVVHDSTQFAFRNGVAEVLGYLPGPGQRRIVGHFALAMDDGGVPLGVLGVEALTPPAQKPRRRGKKHRLYDRTSLQKLAARWGRLVRAVRERIDGRTSVIHLMDREADSYELMHEISEANESFVIRLRHRDRLARSPSDERHEWRPVEEVATGGRFVAKREVPVAPRRHSKDQRDSAVALGVTARPSTSGRRSRFETRGSHRPFTHLLTMQAQKGIGCWPFAALWRDWMPDEMNYFTRLISTDRRERTACTIRPFPSAHAIHDPFARTGPRCSGARRSLR